MVSGSNVAGSAGVALTAGSQLVITTANGSSQEYHLREEKTSGLTGTGGTGFSDGSRSQKADTGGASHTEYGSTAGSSEGSLSLHTGGSLNVRGSGLTAATDISLRGADVSITAGENSQPLLSRQEFHQSGLSLSLSGRLTDPRAAVTGYHGRQPAAGGKRHQISTAVVSAGGGITLNSGRDIHSSALALHAGHHPGYHTAAEPP